MPWRARRSCWGAAGRAAAGSRCRGTPAGRRGIPRDWTCGIGDWGLGDESPASLVTHPQASAPALQTVIYLSPLRYSIRGKYCTIDLYYFEIQRNFTVD